MPLRKDDGSPGLLHSGRFGLQVMEDLHVPDIADIRDTQLLSGTQTHPFGRCMCSWCRGNGLALFRDLTFVASAYLLEPCDIRYRQSGEYGVGRDRLPAKIARPLEEVANKLGVKPYMEYALSYWCVPQTLACLPAVMPDCCGVQSVQLQAQGLGRTSGLRQPRANPQVLWMP